jgi:hypothetical protein
MPHAGICAGGAGQPAFLPRCAPVKTGEEWWMKVPYGEGLASHTGPESCVWTRKSAGEALTGEVRAGLLSRERSC